MQKQLFWSNLAGLQSKEPPSNFPSNFQPAELTEAMQNL